MGHECYGSSFCHSSSYDYYNKRAWYVPPKTATYSVLVRTSHNSTRVNGLSKSVADEFVSDWSSHKVTVLTLKGTNLTYGVRSSCITEITVTKE